MKIKSMALLFAVIIMISQAPIIGLAEGGVTIIDTAGKIWGAFGQYVEYEMDGVKYNTKSAPAHKNREAWQRMTDAQRRLTYNTVYTKSAKKAAFGDDGFQEITLWNKMSSSYYKANKLWKERIAKRDYPELHARFGTGKSLVTMYPDYTEIKNYQIPSAIAANDRARTFRAALAEVEKEYQIGKEYYEKTVEMRTKGIANVVTITITQCTLMLSDMLFVPSVVKGATNEASGQIADIINFLRGLASMEDRDFESKFARYLSGEPGVPFTPEETVKLFGALMESYAKMAESTLPRIDAAMKKLRFRYEMLLAEYQYHLNEQELRRREKQREMEEYEQALLEEFEGERIPPSGNYEGLNFSWFTAEQLYNQYGPHIDYTGTERRDAVFQAVLAKKAELDEEAGCDALILCQNIIDTYNAAADCIADREEELGFLRADVERGCDPSAIRSYTSVPLNEGEGADFTGLVTFEEASSIGGNIAQQFKENWPRLFESLERGISNLTPLRNRARQFLIDKDDLASDLEPHLAALSSYLEQLRRLKEDYYQLYQSVVWVPAGYNQVDFYNPLYRGEYQKNTVYDTIYEQIWPSEKLYSDVVNETVLTIEEMDGTIPINLFGSAYSLYSTVSDHLAELQDRQIATREARDKFIADEATYYNKMETRLRAYLKVQEKMEEKFKELKQITDNYEPLWEGAYFEGAGDYKNYYNYDTTQIVYSAFDANGIRNYLRGGGNRFLLLSNIRAVAEYASAYEAIVPDLIAQLQMLDIEMDGLADGALGDYAESKGLELKGFYQFRDQYMGFKWTRLESDNYFDLRDINYIMSAVSGDTPMFQQMRDYRQELIGCLNASSVNVVKVSKRLYEIHKYASRVYDLYRGSTFNQSLLTEEQRTELLNYYQDPDDDNGIQDTLYQITVKHKGTSYSYYGMPSGNGTTYLDPIGGFEEPALAGDRVKLTAPLYPPLASNATNATAAASVYGPNGWEPLNNVNSAQPMTTETSGEVNIYPDTRIMLFASNNVEIEIDKENDTITLYASGLESGKEYKFDWDITYTDDGYTAKHETGDMIRTITYEPTVVAEAVLEESSATSAVVTVTNMMGNRINGYYVYVEGYGEEGELLTTAGAPLAAMDNMQTVEMTLELDRPVYRVWAYAESSKSTTPAALIIKKDGAAAANIKVAPSSTLQYTAQVLDSFGDTLTGKSVAWSVAPSGQGISVNNGTVTIAGNASPGSYTVKASAGGTAYDEVTLAVEDQSPQSGLIFNGLAKSGDVISGELTLQIVNKEAGLNSCDIIVALYEKGIDKLERLTKVTVSLNQGTNEIRLEDLSFTVVTTKNYEVRVFCWMPGNVPRPIANVSMSDI